MQLGLTALRRADRDSNMSRFTASVIDRVPYLEQDIMALACKKFHMKRARLLETKLDKQVHFLTTTEED